MLGREVRTGAPQQAARQYHHWIKAGRALPHRGAGTGALGKQGCEVEVKTSMPGVLGDDP